MTPVRYRTIDVDGLDVFHREAGNLESPRLLLLHGFPTSSHMFRDLIPRLADRFHAVATDVPGFGRTTMPARDEFNSTSVNTLGLTEDGPRFGPPGFEVNLFYVAGQVSLTLSGAGALSVDHLLARKRASSVSPNGHEQAV